MNALKVVTPETGRSNKFQAPTITTTTPVQGKEIDLTFVNMVNRKRTALEYIEKVERLRAEKKSKRMWHNVKDFIEDLMGAVGIFVMLYAMCIIGSIF